MQSTELSSAYWNDRYITSNTGWDLGEVSPPLKAFFDTLVDKQLRILIPGAGNAYEVEYLYENGFSNVYLLDFAPKALQNFKLRVPEFPDEQLVCEDFFEHAGVYDLVIENTFFCALHKDLRSKYVAHMYSLLANQGHLVGLLFNREIGTDAPPWGGSIGEYKEVFATRFSLNEQSIVEALNSHASRQGWECFMNLAK